MFFREISSLVTSLVKPLLSRNFCQKSLTVNFRNFHTVLLFAWLLGNKQKMIFIIQFCKQIFGMVNFPSKKCVNSIMYSHSQRLFQIRLFLRLNSRKFLQNRVIFQNENLPSLKKSLKYGLMKPFSDSHETPR